jgi:uncharacterized protein
MAVETTPINPPPKVLEPRITIRHVRKILLYASAVLVSFWLSGISVVIGQDLQLIPTYHRVVDESHILSPEMFAALDQKLSNYEQEKGTQIAVVIVQTTQPEAIEQFANRVGNDWKLGRADVGDGIILVLAIADRASRIEVARALEPALPDIQAHRILREYATPLFAKQDYAGGINVALDMIFKSLALEALPPVNIESAPSAPNLASSFLVYILSFSILVITASACYTLHWLGFVMTSIVSIFGGFLTKYAIDFYLPNKAISLSVGILTGILLAFASYFVGKKMAYLTASPQTSKKSKSGSVKNHPSSFSRHDDSSQEDSSSGSSSYDSSSSSDSSSGGGGDFAGGGASDKW